MSLSSSKQNQYDLLVGERKACRLCTQLKNPACFEELDSEEIGPYSLWHGDINARLVVVAKDFAPVAKFKEFGGRPGINVQTNKRLSRYLSLAGFDAGDIAQSYKGSGLFFTNAVLCLPGGDVMRTDVRQRDMSTCAAMFLRRTIDIISPKAVVSLGSQAGAAVLECYSIAQRGEIDGGNGMTLSNGLRFFALPHPMASVRKSKHEAGWRAVGEWLGP